MSKPKTLFEKVWDAHVVRAAEGEPTLLYIDLAPGSRSHLTAGVRRPSPRGPQGSPYRPDLRHHRSQRPDHLGRAARHQRSDRGATDCYAAEELRGQSAFRYSTSARGGRESFTSSGRSLASHSRARPLFAATATPARMAHSARWPSASAPRKSSTCWPRSASRRPSRAACGFPSQGALPQGTTSKDLILDIIRRLGTDGGTGYVIEYAGEAVRALTMEERMTVCNMSIECGARAGMIAPDDTTFAYLEGRPFAPKGSAWNEAVAPGANSLPTTAQPSIAKSPSTARSLNRS